MCLIVGLVSICFYMFSFLLLLLLLLAASASAAPRGGAISLLAYAGTRIFFSYRFLLCFRTKQCDSRRATLYKKTLRSPFRIVFFGVFLSVWHFASVFTVFLLTLDFLHLPASTCISISALCGGGGGWGGGLMTSMRMRLTCTVSLSALCIGGEGAG